MIPYPVASKFLPFVAAPFPRVFCAVPALPPLKDGSLVYVLTMPDFRIAFSAT